MKLAVGYQLAEEGEESIIEAVRDFREHVGEVYFPWLEMASGRSPMVSAEEAADERVRKRFEEDLAALAGMGMKLDLLLNASCYGRLACSTMLADLVCSVVERLLEGPGLQIVTTMSPIIAEVIRGRFPGLEIRASVNMRLGTVQAMEYVAGLFDSYHVQREYNRDMGRLKELKAWADVHGKRLLMLVNSGCLNWCAVQTFHDNVVAHEAEIVKTGNPVSNAPAHCWQFLSKRKNWAWFLRNSWIRPEDLHHYEGLFDTVKLATRMHANPRRVIEAYVRGRFEGNLPDLFEPGHGPVFAPSVIDNSRFPEDWFEKTTSCDKRCHKCSYCTSVLEKVLV